MPSTLSSKMLLLKALLSMGYTEVGRVNVKSREGKGVQLCWTAFWGAGGRHSHHSEKQGEPTLGKSLQGSFLLWTECVWPQILVWW